MSWQRQVLFIGGFDPKSSAHYHRMYRDAASQRPTSAAGETVHVSKQRQRDGIYAHWEVHWQQPNQDPVQTRYTVMGWHDIVLAHWPRTWQRLIHDYISVYVTGWLDGTFWRLRSTSRATFWLGLYPLLLCGIVLGLGLSLAAGLALSLDADVMLALGCALVPCAWLWRWIANTLDSEWLLRLFGFAYDQSCDRLPELEQRLDGFARYVISQAEHMRDTHGRELMIVTHSAGAILAVSVLARALAQAPWLGQAGGPALSLLTLGHCTPLLALRPHARRFRQELATLARHPQLNWVDYSAPTDWAAFNPPAPWLDAPLQGRCKRALSPRFHQVLAPERYRQLLQWRYRHELHMQYIKAPDRPDGYDPVALTASPLTLAEQHASHFDAA